MYKKNDFKIIIIYYFIASYHISKMVSVREMKYVKLSQVEHILTRPDTYVGNPNTSTRNRWVMDAVTDCVVLRETTLSDGAVKCFDECP